MQLFHFNLKLDITEIFHSSHDFAMTKREIFVSKFRYICHNIYIFSIPKNLTEKIIQVKTEKFSFFLITFSIFL